MAVNADAQPTPSANGSPVPATTTDAGRSSAGSSVEAPLPLPLSTTMVATPAVASAAGAVTLSRCSSLFARSIVAASPLTVTVGVLPATLRLRPNRRNGPPALIRVVSR